MIPELKKYLERYELEYQEYRQHITDEARLEMLDEAHQRFLNDQASDLAEARKEGKGEGIAEGIAKTARNMKRKGYSLSGIAKVTGLSRAEIERLD